MIKARDERIDALEDQNANLAIALVKFKHRVDKLQRTVDGLVGDGSDSRTSLEQLEDAPHDAVECSTCDHLEESHQADPANPGFVKCVALNGSGGPCECTEFVPKEQ